MRGMLAAVALTLVAPALAGAQVACGDTIGKGQTVTLTADVGPCDVPGVPAALFVEGGTLDLGGRTVTCADTNGDGLIPDGIRLRGEKSKVMNGTVVGCYWGLDIGDDGMSGGKTFGKHRVKHLTVENSLVDGVIVWTDKTALIDVTSTNARGHGFVIHGNRSKLVSVVATGNANDGILTESKTITLRGATATGNAGDGFLLFGAKESRLMTCEGSGNGGSGVVIFGDKNKVRESIANDNAENGFVLYDSPLHRSPNRILGGEAHGNGGFDLIDCLGRSKISDLDYATVSSDCP